MSTTTADPVLTWEGYYTAAGLKWNIPPAVLAGLVSVESGGREGLTSSAGASGLTQFMPATADSYGVNVAPGHAASQIDGAAHYLHDLGFAQDPALALAKYNAGPGNPAAGAGYAQKVLDAAKRYAHLGGTVPASSPIGGTDTTSTGDASGEWGGGILAPLFQLTAKGLLYIALMVGGAALIWVGMRRTVEDDAK